MASEPYVSQSAHTALHECTVEDPYDGWYASHWLLLCLVPGPVGVSGISPLRKVSHGPPTPLHAFRSHCHSRAAHPRSLWGKGATRISPMTTGNRGWGTARQGGRTMGVSLPAQRSAPIRPGKPDTDLGIGYHGEIHRRMDLCFPIQTQRKSSFLEMDRYSPARRYQIEAVRPSESIRNPCVEAIGIPV